MPEYMEQALLLNASYEPLKVVDWQKAITLWCQQKVEVLAVHDRFRAGDPSWVDRTGADSCHTVWFELHEDLIATLGLRR